MSVMSAFSGNQSGQQSKEFIAGETVVSRYRHTFRIQRTMSVVDQATLNTEGVAESFDEQIEYHGPRFPLPIGLRHDDSYYVWPMGMYLDRIALKYYGDPTLWWIIADFNNIRDPRIIEEGRMLRFPSTSRFLLEIQPLLV